MDSPLTAVPDHLLMEILLRLPDPAGLARASASCASFRRLTTDASFLRSFRRIHAPPLLGFLEPGKFCPALPPHPSAPAAHALALAVDLTFSFLPSQCRWTVQDIRDGCVLLHREPGAGEVPLVFRELAVCDPLHRRYVLLPPIPDNLAASVEHPLPHPFLAPLSEEVVAAAEETTFRVIYLVRGKTKLAAFVFSSSIEQWQAAASKGWGDFVHDHDNGDSAMISRTNPSYLRRHYAYGCFNWDWSVIGRKELLMLDTKKMDFSIASLLPGERSAKGVAIVEAGEGRLGVFGLHGENEFASHLSYTILQNRGERPSQWQRKRQSH